MGKHVPSRLEQQIERDEIRDFTKTVAQIQWLLLTMVLFYFVLENAVITAHPELVFIIVAYVVFIVLFHYLKFLAQHRDWKLAIETWVMILFVTVILWYTGKSDSPLSNLYLLIIITSALTVGRVTALLQVALISVCYLSLGVAQQSLGIFSAQYTLTFVTQIVPFLLVAYLTTMLAGDIHKTQKRMHILLERDDLTDLHGMASFHNLIETEVIRAARYQRPFSILLIDIDELNNINNAHDNDTGDAVIKNTARVITNSVRLSDVVARYEGDKFIVMLVETDMHGAKTVAEQIRLNVKEMPLKIDHKHLDTTVSIGISSYPNGAYDIHEIIAKAEKYLSQAKLSGKDCIVCGGEKVG